MVPQLREDQAVPQVRAYPPVLRRCERRRQLNIMLYKIARIIAGPLYFLLSNIYFSREQRFE